MNIGILGTGKIVQEALPMFQTLNLGKKYILGTEHSVEKTKQLVETYGLDGCFFDYDELLKSDVDIIYVALPNDLHFSFGKQALLAGKHVIMEKPITVTLEELRELRAIAREKQLFLLEAMSTHYLPAFRSMKAHLAEVGEVKLVNMQFCQYSSRYDDFQRGIVAPAFDPKRAGGALMDLNVYNIHGILGLFGKPQKVQYYPNMERGVDTSGVLILQYPSFQAVLSAAKDCEAFAGTMIQGTRGCMQTCGKMNRVEDYEIVDRWGNVRAFDFKNGIYRLQYEFDQFLDIIWNQRWEAAEKALEISDQAMEILSLARSEAGGGILQN